jgi:hypothetical protein
MAMPVTLISIAKSGSKTRASVALRLRQRTWPRPA